jgi:hypothetical protein
MHDPSRHRPSYPSLADVREVHADHVGANLCHGVRSFCGLDPADFHDWFVLVQGPRCDPGRIM